MSYKDETQESLSGRQTNISDIQIVVNLPFCKRACRHCNRENLFAPQEDCMKAYVDALEREAASLQDDLEGKRVSCVHITGGMPLMMPQGSLGRITQMLKQYFELNKDAEILVDAHPGLLQKESLAECVEAGITRISLSFITLNYKEFRQINPPFDVGDFQSSAWLMRQEGFRNFDVRILVGLPFQTLESLRSNVFEATGMGPVGIKYVPFVLRTGTPLAKDYEAGEHLGIPGAQACQTLFDEAASIVRRDGYKAVSKTWFAFEGHGSKNEQHRVRGGQTVGLGAGASTCFDGFCYSNSSDVELYLQHSHEPELMCKNIIELTDKTKAQLFALKALDAPNGINICAFTEAYGMDLREALPQTDALLKAGLIEEANGNVAKTTRGIVDVAAYEQIMTQ